jgi:plastocyanin
MERHTLGVWLTALLAFSVPQPITAEDEPLSVTGIFERAPSAPSAVGGVPNAHAIPQPIRVKPGTVVNFAVSGFHQILVYVPGTRAEALVVPASGTFVDDHSNLYYQGVLAVGRSASSKAATNTQSRIEPVLFSEPGRYLVICNVRRHFLNGMFGYVIVGDGGDAQTHTEANR